MARPPCSGPEGEPLAPPYSGRDLVFEQRQYPAWSPQDRDFDEVGQVTLSAASTVFENIVTYNVPKACEAAVLWWGQDVAVSAAYQDVEWRVVVNEEVRVIFPAIIQVAGMTQDTLRCLNVFAGPGSKVAVQGRNSNVSTRVVRACLKGFFRPAPPRNQ